jgi:hypothetical protein
MTYSFLAGGLALAAFTQSRAWASLSRRVSDHRLMLV